MKFDKIFFLFIAIFAISKTANPEPKTKDALYVMDGIPSLDSFLSLVEERKIEKVFLYIGDIVRDYEKLSLGKLPIKGDTESKGLIQTLLDKNIEVNLMLYYNQPAEYDLEKVENVAKALGELRTRIKFHHLLFHLIDFMYDELENMVKMYEIFGKYVPVSFLSHFTDWTNYKEGKIVSKFDITKYLSEEFMQKYAEWDNMLDIFMEVTNYSELVDPENKYQEMLEILEERHPNNSVSKIYKQEAYGKDFIMKYYE